MTSLTDFGFVLTSVTALSVMSDSDSALKTRANELSMNIVASASVSDDLGVDKSQAALLGINANGEIVSFTQDDSAPDHVQNIVNAVYNSPALQASDPPVYDENKLYATNDLVTYEGATYRATVIIYDHDYLPGADGSLWEEVV